LTARLPRHKVLVAPLLAAATTISASQKERTASRDSRIASREVVIEIVPGADQPVTIGEASVHFPGSDEEWNKCVRDYADTGRWKLSWCVSLRLRLGAMRQPMVEETRND